MNTSANQRPNFIFIMSDDHAAHAMSCYGSRINQTPHLDRIAKEGMRFDNCFCTNAICSPSRAVILTGTHSHINGVTTLNTTNWDGRKENVAKILQRAGYQTAIFGKWHIGEQPHQHPSGFNEWAVLPGQGLYHDPEFITPAGRETVRGYATDIITDKSLSWLEQRDHSKPFFLCVHHKAPHREWEPDAKHADLYENETIREPETLFDTYQTRSEAAKRARMRMEHLKELDLKQPVPQGLTPEEEKKWRYQRYIKDYLRCVASIDDNIARLLDYLDTHGLTDNTVVMYTSDQGFFLGDHGWFDKRFMYEESLRMPFIIRWPQAIQAGSINRDVISNLDFAQTWIELAQAGEAPSFMQGRSFAPLLQGQTPPDWRQSVYYRYWMHNDSSHNTTAHYGIRTQRHKLIYYYGDPCGQPGAKGPCTPPEWELFDLENDPLELNNVYDHPDYADTLAQLKKELADLQEVYQDTPWTPEQSTELQK